MNVIVLPMAVPRFLVLLFMGRFLGSLFDCFPNVRTAMKVADYCMACDITLLLLPFVCKMLRWTLERPSFLVQTVFNICDCICCLQYWTERGVTLALAAALICAGSSLDQIMSPGKKPEEPELVSTLSPEQGPQRILKAFAGVCGNSTSANSSYENSSLALGFEVEEELLNKYKCRECSRTFHAGIFSANLANELGVDAATLTTHVVDNGPGNGINVVVNGAPASASDWLAAQNGTEISERLVAPRDWSLHDLAALFAVFGVALFTIMFFVVSSLIFTETPPWYSINRLKRTLLVAKLRSFLRLRWRKQSFRFRNFTDKSPLINAIEMQQIPCEALEQRVLQAERAELQPELGEAEQQTCTAQRFMSPAPRPNDDYANTMYPRVARYTKQMPSGAVTGSRSGFWEEEEQTPKRGLFEAWRTLSVNTLRDEQHAQLHRHMAVRGFRIRDVPRDNNCQFHALVDQLEQVGINGWTAQRLRTNTVQWLQENGERSMDHGTAPGGRTYLKDAVGVPDWEAYIDEMSRHDVTWGDEATLLAASVLFKAEIVIISSTSEEYCHIVTPPDSWEVPLHTRIYLGHYHEFHYVSARAV